MEKLRAQFHAPIGRMTMAFSALEDTLGWLMGEILGGDDEVRNIISSQASFARLLNITDGLYRKKVTDPALVAKWDALVPRISGAEEKRNRVTHSTWGIWWEEWPNVFVSQEKNAVRRRRGLQASKEKASPQRVTEVAEEIEQSRRHRLPNRDQQEGLHPHIRPSPEDSRESEQHVGGYRRGRRILNVSVLRKMMSTTLHRSRPRDSMAP